MSKRATLHVGLVVASLVAAFCVLNWIYGYVIAFQSETNDCFFLFGRPFLLEFLDHPAGPLRYAVRFLGQFYYYQWLGALIVSACIICFGVLFHRVLVKLDSPAPVSMAIPPCVLLLILHTSTLYALHDTLGLCVSCGVFLVYLSLPGKMAKKIFALLATPVVYFCAGFHVWLLVAWIVASQWLDPSRRQGLVFNAFYVAVSIAMPVIAWRWVYFIPLYNAVMYPVVLGPPVRAGGAGQTSAQFTMDCALAIAIGGSLLLIPFLGRLLTSSRLATLRQIASGRRTRVALTMACCVVAILVHWVRYDAPLAIAVACRQLYKQQQWDALLQKARDNPFGDLRVQFMTNLALSHKGRLLDEMFCYPQPWGTRGLFLNFSGMGVTSPDQDDTAEGMYNSDLLYEMGHANFAFRHAYNSMCMRGKTCERMQRMAQCAMLNGNDALARKYLNLLEKTIFYRDSARRYKLMISDPASAEREFGELRKRLPTVDGFGHPVRHFATLLQSNPDNRMARDYLMAWLLLDKQQDSLDAVCADIGQLSDVGYDALPTHCQEAVLLKEKVQHIPVDMQGFRCDDATVARMDEFVQTMSGHGGARDTNSVRVLYGDTYMFYWFFVATPSDAAQAAGANVGFGGQSRVE